jgi:hypothetical protein
MEHGQLGRDVGGRAILGTSERETVDSHSISNSFGDAW